MIKGVHRTYLPLVQVSSCPIFHQYPEAQKGNSVHQGRNMWKTPPSGNLIPTNPPKRGGEKLNGLMPRGIANWGYPKPEIPGIWV